MEYAIANMPERNPILEIGSFCGLSTTVLSYLLEKHSKTNAIYTCDKCCYERQIDEKLVEELLVEGATIGCFPNLYGALSGNMPGQVITL